MTNTADIATRRVRKKYVGAFTVRLHGAFQLARRSGKRSEIGVVVDGDEEVYILRVRLVCGERAD